MNHKPAHNCYAKDNKISHMKKYIGILFIFFTVSMVNAQAIKGSLNAIKSNDFVTLATYLEKDIELCLDESPKRIKKNKAIENLKAFFQSQGINGMTVEHSGSNMMKDSGFKIVTVKGTNAKYRMFLYAEDGSNGNLIQEIRLDKI